MRLCSPLCPYCSLFHSNCVPTVSQFHFNCFPIPLQLVPIPFQSCPHSIPILSPFHSNLCLMQVTCYDWDSDGSHDLIGEFMTNLTEITEAYQSGKKIQWDCINPAKKKKKKYKNSGTIYLNGIKVRCLEM